MVDENLEKMNQEVLSERMWEEDSAAALGALPVAAPPPHPLPLPHTLAKDTHILTIPQSLFVQRTNHY